MASKAAPDIDPEVYKLTALCSQIALSTAALKAKLIQGPAAGLCHKRLAYQSAVRLAETDEAFNHRALYDRLYHITVAGETDRRTAFDGGAAQHAAEAYHKLLSDAAGRARSTSNRHVQPVLVPSPMLDAVLAHRGASLDGALAASQASMDTLAHYDWLPSPAPPIAWRSSLRAIQAKTLVPLLRDMADALGQALATIGAIEAFVEAALSHTRTFREGSAAKRLIPIFARDPVVTQERIVTAGLMSNVAFQKGIRELEALGVCAELTKRKRHRAWAAIGNGLLPSFQGIALPVFLNEKEHSQNASEVTPDEDWNDYSEFDNLTKAMDAIDRLVTT